jgi:hypothetical protein
MIKKTLLDTIHNLSHYARKTAKNVLKPVNILYSSVLLGLALSSSPLKSQSAPDTLWANGIFNTKNIENTEIIPQVSLFLRPHQMSMTIPNVIYQYITDNNGEVTYNLPVFIDTTIGINNVVNNGFSAFPNFGNELNIFFSKQEKGIVEIYTMTGQLINSQEFNADRTYMNFEKLPLGMYVYSIKTESGHVHNSKFLKQNTTITGPSQKPNQNGNGLKNIEIYEAEYWAKWEKEGYHTDSTLITLNQGNNPPIILNMEPIAPDTLWANGFILTKNIETTGSVLNVSLYLRPHQMSIITPDTTYQYTTDGNGMTIYDLPVFIGPITKKNKKENNLKNLETIQAEYWAKWEKEGFYTDSTLITLNEGNNPPIFLNMTPLPGLPKNQDIAGIIYNGDNNYAPVSGATVILEHLNTGEVFTQITGSDGSFFFQDMPVRMGWTGTDQNYLFSAGGIEGMYSFADVPYTTPMYLENTWTANDTINDNFNVVLKNKLETSSAIHIRQQTMHSTRQTDVLYYFKPEVPSSSRELFNNYFNQLMQDENNVFNFIETFSPIHGITGITIGNGTPNTQSYSEEIVTPLGHTLYPVKWANNTMSPGNYIVFVHEIKRAIGLTEVAWPSVMKTPALVYTQEDKDIGMFERAYWNSVYQDEKTWISLKHYLAEDLSSKVQKENSHDDKNENNFLKTNNYYTDITLLHNQSFNYFNKFFCFYVSYKALLIIVLVWWIFFRF